MAAPAQLLPGPSPNSDAASMMLEILHCSFMSLRGASGLEGSKIAAFAGFGVLLPRVQAVFTRSHFTNHAILPMSKNRMRDAGTRILIANEKTKEETKKAIYATKGARVRITQEFLHRACMKHSCSK